LCLTSRPRAITRNHVIFELIYRSLLAPDANPACIADIVRVARAFNRSHDITGVLVFDGERFCQLLEGDATTVAALGERIAKDARHHRFEILQQGSRESARRFPGWSMAYALDPNGALAPLFERGRGADAGGMLERTVPQLDLDAAAAR
jgi:hypothetical protein